MPGQSGFGEGGYGEGGFGGNSETIKNLGFETGDSDGNPASWILSFLWGTEEYAQFAITTDLSVQGGNPPLYGSVEGFEGAWLENDLWVATLSSPVAAVYDTSNPPTQTAERFAVGWQGNETFYYENPPYTAAVYGATAYEAFETGWANSPYLTEFQGAGIDLTLWPMNGGGAEAFETGWVTGYISTFTTELSSASYTGLRALSAETFEHLKEDAVYSVVAATNVFTQVAHNLSANYQIYFQQSIGGSLPAPLVAGVPYYVRTAPTADTFTIALTEGAGSDLDITDAGSGLLYLHVVREFWATVL